MPFVTDYTPISAALQLGGIAGAGTGMAAAAQKRLQDQQLAYQIAQDRIRNQMLAEQSLRERTSRDQSNQIQTALEYAKLGQNQKQFEQEQSLEASKAKAQELLAQSRLGQSGEQATARQTQAKESLDLRKQLGADVMQRFEAEQPLRQEQGQRAQRGADRQEFGQLQRIVGDPLMESLQPELFTYAKNRLQQIISGQPTTPAAPPSPIRIPPNALSPGTSAPVTLPQAQPQSVVNAQPTGEKTQAGVDIFEVTLPNGQVSKVPAPETAQEYSTIPPGPYYDTINDVIGFKQG